MIQTPAVSEQPVIHLSAADWVFVTVAVAVAWYAFRSLIQMWAKAKADLQKAEQALEEERTQRILKQQGSLEKAVQEVSKLVNELKSWVALEFVRRPDHERDIDRLHEAITDHAERFTRELESHRDQCPGRRG